MKQASDKNQTDPAITTSKPERRRILIWGILCTLCFAVIFAFKPNLMQRLDYLEYDFLLAKFPNNHASNKLVIVDLDEKSLNRYGQWPWPRYRVAGLLDKVAAMQPDIISLDIVFCRTGQNFSGAPAERSGRCLQD